MSVGFFCFWKSTLAKFQFSGYQIIHAHPKK